MKELERIESRDNAKLKLVGKLHTPKHRREAGLFVAEGVRLVETAADAEWPLEFAFVSDGAVKNARVKAIVKKLQARSCPVYQMTDELFGKAASTVNSQGILLVMGQRLFTWREVFHNPRGDGPLVAVLDGIQDPGNAGTIIRTADALGCSGVVCLNGTVDLFNDKVVRSAMGSLFYIPYLDNISRENFIDVCHDNEVNIVATALDKMATKHYLSDYNSPTALVFGSEGNGISKEIMEAADKKVYIPMSGKAESLNVATAAAIVLYEANRQRAIL